MAGKKASQVLTGTNAKVFLEGEEIGFWTNFSAIVTINYDDVYVGSDVMRKETSRQGDGSLSHQIINSIGPKLFNKIRAKKDTEFVIEAEIASDSTGETQNMTLSNVTFDSIPLANWAKGEVVTSEMSFRFAPSTTQFPQLIN